MRNRTVHLIFVGLAAQVLGQGAGAPRYAQPTLLPGDRPVDSYAIYSQLLKSGPIEWRDVSRTQWLIEDTTSAIPLDVACHPASGADSMVMNPHEAVKPPEDRQAEWKEVLADFDQHCHDVIQLDQNGFRTELPVRLLNADDKRRFMQDPIKPPAEFADGAGLHLFSEVFFNTNHTLALVEEGMWCGALCGNWTWVVLARGEGRWAMLPWVRTYAIS